MARALVAGGAGFIGSHVVDRLLAEGHTVAVIDDLSSGRLSNLSGEAEFIQGDVRGERAAQALKAFKPDFLFHLAAQIDVRKSVADPAFDADVNVVGLLRMLKAAEEVGTRRVVFSSSGGTVYGEAETLPTDESAPTDPVSPYGIAKLTCERYIAYFTRWTQISGVCLRYANVYGPRQDPHGEAGVVAIFGGRLLKGETCAIFGDGEATRDYVHVSDVAEANFLAMERGEGLCINIGTGVETSVNDLYAALAAVCGVSEPAEHKPARAGELQRSALSNRMAAEVLGWAPKIELRAGLAAYVDYLRAQG